MYIQFKVSLEFKVELKLLFEFTVPANQRRGGVTNRRGLQSGAVRTARTILLNRPAWPCMFQSAKARGGGCNAAKRPIRAAGVQLHQSAKPPETKRQTAAGAQLHLTAGAFSRAPQRAGEGAVQQRAQSAPREHSCAKDCRRGREVRGTGSRHARAIANAAPLSFAVGVGRGARSVGPQLPG